MRVSCAVCCLFFLLAFVNSVPIVKREAEEDLSPLNEVYVYETDEPAVDGERGDRDKRKIGIVKLGVTNGIINFVFGKLDSFLDAKTRALAVLDESNKVKNAAFGIDNTQSATGQFISSLVASKVQAATGSIGPVINSAQTFFTGAKTGLANAFVSKLAPLSSIAGAASGGLSAGNAGGSASGASTGAGPSAGGSLNLGANASGLLSGLLSSKLNSITSLSQSSGNNTGGNNGGANGNSGSASTGAGATSGAGTGLNLGAFAHLGGYDYSPPQAAY